jgi:hypothetical protein
MSYDPASADYQPRDPYYRQNRVQVNVEQEEMKRQAYMRETAANQIRGAGAIGRETLVSRSAGLEYQMERLAKTVASTEELFNQLGIRMTPFVRSMPIQEQEKRTHTSDDSQSPLADQVSRLADQLDRINRGMTYLIDGVDL